MQVRVQGYAPTVKSFRTLRAAQLAAAKIETEIDEGKVARGMAPRNTLAAAIQRYMDEHPGKDTGKLQFWSERLGATKLRQVSPDLIAEVRGELARGNFQRADPKAKRTSLKDGEKPRQFKRACATVNRYLSALSRVFTVARKEWRWVTINPVLDVSKLPEGKSRSKVLTEDERARLFEQTAKDPTLHTFVVVALSTTARAGELKRLTWADVDLEAGSMIFRDTKNGTARTAWLIGEAKTQMDKLAEAPHKHSDRVYKNPSGRGKSGYQYHEPFSTAVKAAGITGLVFHGLRHTAATWLAAQGATEQQLRAIGGWKSNVVNKYVHLAALDTKAAVQKLATKLSAEK